MQSPATFPRLWSRRAFCAGWPGSIQPQSRVDFLVKWQRFDMERTHLDSLNATLDLAALYLELA